MSRALLWCEARCHYTLARTHYGQSVCHETAPGSFGVKGAAAMAKRAGWRVVRGEWCCPACLKAAKEMEDE